MFNTHVKSFCKILLLTSGIFSLYVKDLLAYFLILPFGDLF